MNSKSSLSVLVVAISLVGLLGCESAEQKACREDGAAALTAWTAAAAAVPGAKTAATDAITAAATAADTALTTAQAALAAVPADDATNTALTALTDKIKAKAKGDDAQVQAVLTAAQAAAKGETAAPPKGFEAEVTEATALYTTLNANAEAKTKAQADVDAATAAKAAADARKTALDALDGQVADIGTAAGASDWTAAGEKATALGETLGDAAPAELKAAAEAVTKAKASCDAVPK